MSTPVQVICFHCYVRFTWIEGTVESCPHCGMNFQKLPEIEPPNYKEKWEGTTIIAK
jgi:hypothetical protein